MYYYALEGHTNKNVNENDIYNGLYQQFAEHQFVIKDYKEFRRYYKMARVYGATSLGFKARYFLSYFPVIIEIARRTKKRLKRV